MTLQENEIDFELENLDDYNTLQKLFINDKRIMLVARKDELHHDSKPRYMVCNQRNILWEQVTEDIWGSHNYGETLRIFGERVVSEASLVEKNINARNPESLKQFIKNDCYPMGKTNIEGRVVVLDTKTWREEYKRGDEQLVMANCGFGCDMAGRGGKIYYTNLITGEKNMCYADGILGYPIAEKLPQWAKDVLAEKKLELFKPTDKKPKDRDER